MTQAQQIYEYLKAGNTLTPLEALQKFGCLRLAARIADLRKQGHIIWTNTITVNNKTFAAYKLTK